MGTIAEMERDSELLAIRAEARSICEEQGIEDMESFAKIEHALRYRAFRHAIRPLLELKTSLMLHMLPTKISVLSADGVLLPFEMPKPNEDQQRLLDEADKMIEYWARRYKFDLPKKSDV